MNDVQERVEKNRWHDLNKPFEMCMNNKAQQTDCNVPQSLIIDCTRVWNIDAIRFFFSLTARIIKNVR